MSEYFGHAIHGDDCAALVQASSGVGDHLKRVMRELPQLVRMGSVVRLGKFIYPHVLKAYREEKIPQEKVDKRLAVGLAQLSHRAVDSFFKPVYRQLAPEYYDNKYAASPSDIRIMHDIVLYHARKSLQSSAGDPLYDPLMFSHLIRFDAAQSPSSARFLETVFGGRVIQELLEHHTLFPDDADTDTRLQAYIKALDPVYIDTARYADMVAEPYLNHVQRYIVDPYFYDAEDPLIALAIDIRAGKAADVERLQAAMDQESELSQWGKSLARGVRFFEAAQDYVDGRFDLDTLNSKILL